MHSFYDSEQANPLDMDTLVTRVALVQRTTIEFVEETQMAQKLSNDLHTKRDAPVQ